MGSVRAARERMEAESRLSQDSMDTPQASWPLGANQSFQQAQNRGAAPQRPPRPSYVPSILAEQGQSGEYDQGSMSQHAKYWEPNYATPTTPTSRDSAGSSVGSIPDFPVPTIPVNVPQANPRRIQNMGPPPTQRRGPSSYYSQSSFVAPIPEESYEMPQHSPGTGRRGRIVSEDWQDDTPDIYIDRSSTISGPGEHLVEPAGLVRNASMGKQYKPSLTTVRPANETLRHPKGYAAPQPTVVDRSHLAVEHTVFVESVDSDDEDTSQRGRHSMEGTTFLRDQSEDSDLRKEALLGEKDILVSPIESRDSSPTRQDPRVNHLMAGLEKGGAIPLGTTPPAVADSRPKPAAFDFATEASNRASLTSLSDLIRRATKVKTNLDKGRTASRLGLLDFFSTSKSDLLKAPKDDRPRESLTDMLEAFPPPAINASPNRENSHDSRWPSPFVNHPGDMHHAEHKAMQQQNRRKQKSQGRRCCGLPLWGFILMVVLLIVLIAAAVLIPIFLIVIPNQNKANSACPNSFPCSNGGISVSVNDSCQCICTSTFTGPQCTQSAPTPSDCTTADLDGFNQVTIGTKVLPLLSGSSNYSIPLNNTLLLTGFSSNKLYCGDENNLVTFLNVKSPQKRAILPPAPTPVAELVPRQAPAATSDHGVNSILVDGPAPTPTSSGAAPTSTTPTTRQVGFAQTAILYVLQKTTLENAKVMKIRLDQAFQNGNWFGPVVGSGSVIIDLRLSKVTINGASVGQAS